MITATGDSAANKLTKLENELELERAKFAEGGEVDGAWLKQTVRALLEWVPENDVGLIAAIGRIARSAAKDRRKN